MVPVYDAAVGKAYVADAHLWRRRIEDLANYDAIIVGGAPGSARLWSQMANFLDQAGGCGCAVCSTAKSAVRLRRPPHNMAGRKPRCSRSSPIFAFRHGGRRPRLRPCGQMTLDEITGGSPYGATTIPEATAHANPPPTNYRAPATKGARLPRPPTSATADAS